MFEERLEEERGRERREQSDRNEECFKTPHTHTYTETGDQTKWLKGCLDNALDRDGTQQLHMVRNAVLRQMSSTHTYTHTKKMDDRMRGILLSEG